MQVYSYKKNSGLIFLIVLQVFDIAGVVKGNSFQAKNQQKDSFSGSDPMIAVTSEKPVVRKELGLDVVTRPTVFLRNAPYVQLVSEQQARQLESVGNGTRVSSDQEQRNTQTGSSGLEISGDQTGQITASGNVVEGSVQKRMIHQEEFDKSVQLYSVRESGGVVAYDNPMYIPSVKKLQSEQQARQLESVGNGTRVSSDQEQRNTQTGSSGLEISGDQTGQIAISGNVFTYDNPMFIDQSNKNLVEPKSANKTLVKQKSAQVGLMPRPSGWINPLSRSNGSRSQGVKPSGSGGNSGLSKVNDGSGVEQQKGAGGQKHVDSAVDVSNAPKNLLMENIYPENIQSASVSAQLKSSSFNPLSPIKGRSQVSKSSVGVKPDVVEGVSKANDALVVEQAHVNGVQQDIGPKVDVSRAEDNLFMENIYPEKSGNAEKNSQFAESNYSNLSKNLAQLHIKFQDFVKFIFSMSVAAKQKFLQYLEKNFSAKGGKSNEGQEDQHLVQSEQLIKETSKPDLGEAIVQEMSQLPEKELSKAVELATSLNKEDKRVDSFDQSNSSGSLVGQVSEGGNSSQRAQNEGDRVVASFNKSDVSKPELNEVVEPLPGQDAVGLLDHEKGKDNLGEGGGQASGVGNTFDQLSLEAQKNELLREKIEIRG